MGAVAGAGHLKVRLRMKGCRPLTDEEIRAVEESFGGPYALRDRAVFAMGVYTGERISAILALRVGDVVQGGRVADSVTYRKATRKGKTESRTVVLHSRARAALTRWVNQLSRGTLLTADDFVFQSRNGHGGRHVSRVQFHRILKAAVAPNELGGKVATHSWRKSYADRMFRELHGDIFRLQQAMGHKNINSTAQYLSFKQEDIDAAIRRMP